MENKGSSYDTTIGIRGIATALPSRSLDLQQLASRNLIESTPEVLADQGFSCAWICDDSRELQSLARQTATQALEDADLAADEIDVLIWAGALPASHHRSAPNNSPCLDQFRYSASWLQDQLECDNASVTAVAQQGCAGMFSALRQARAMLVAEPHLRHVLCVGADALPDGCQREILHNVVSDAACAVVVSRGHTKDRWIDCHQITRGYYWNTPAMTEEIVAAYFPTSKAVISQLLERNQTHPSDLDLLIPTGISAPSWPVLMGMCGIPETSLYQGRRDFGHTIAADPFFHLQQIRRDQSLQRGARILLFTYGFGSTWSAILLNH